MSKKYELGIAFSGGGAKGAAHVGALQAMKEYGIKPDVVAGTSAGSLVATAYAAGLKPVEMIDMFLGLDFFHDVVSPTIPRGGLFDSTPLLECMRRIIPYKNLEELPVPTYVVASDLDHGRPKIFSRGEIAPRVVASCSIPVVFQPMVIGGVHYVDGGAFMNLPVPAIRKQCKKVIAFSVRRLEDEPYKDTVFHVASRSFSIMFMSNLMADAKLADEVIDLDTTGCSPYDIDNLELLFRRGYSDAVAAFERMGYTRQMPPERISFRKRDSLIEDARERFDDVKERFDDVREMIADAKEKIAHLRK